MAFARRVLLPTFLPDSLAENTGSTETPYGLQTTYQVEVEGRTFTFESYTSESGEVLSLDIYLIESSIDVAAATPEGIPDVFARFFQPIEPGTSEWIAGNFQGAPSVEIWWDNQDGSREFRSTIRVGTTAPDGVGNNLLAACLIFPDSPSIENKSCFVPGPEASAQSPPSQQTNPQQESESATTEAQSQPGNAEQTASENLSPGFNFTFGTSVPETDRKIIREGLEYARIFVNQRFGVDSPPTSVFVSANPGELTDMYMSYFGIGTQARNSIIGRWQGLSAEAGFRSIFIFPGPGWRDQRDPQIVLAHEYFHVIQYDLIGQPLADIARTTPPPQLRVYGPNWLIEGSAELIGRLAAAQLSGQSQAGMLAQQASEAKSSIANLQSMETPAGFQTVNPSYQLGLLASNRLTSSIGLETLATYYRLIGGGMEWKSAFEEAFGISPDTFYTEFADFRANGF
ncbi:MAG TPA: hypothetical protein VFS30_04650 [Dehalococcoidia bacterium]|nr:hypothetical protein [Dehalococcoidia bacterium]